MAGDLGDLFVGFFQQVAAVSGGYGVAYLRGVEHLVETGDALLGVGGGGDDLGADDLLAVEEGRFGGGGAGVDA